MTKKIAVIGSGFAGLAAACCLADAGCDVELFEKNSTPGGRARQFSSKGFTFDMGPSWYWMPDVFERFFNKFSKSTADFYQLERLDPSYKIFFSDDLPVDIPASVEKLGEWFDSLEPGSSRQLKAFLDEAAYKYEVGINELVYKPGQSLIEFADLKLIKGVFKLHIFQSMSKYIRKYFKHPKLIQLLEFPVLFLGAMPSKTPALYSLMNYADISLGTWYPMGGMHEIVKAMHQLAISLGVTFHFDTPVEEIHMNAVKAKGLKVKGEIKTFDFIVGGADYHHIEQHLLPEKFRTYDDKYWDTRAMAPSSLIFYLGIDKKLENLSHHNLYFDESFEVHAKEIYEDPKWPSKPLFYVCCTSKTDPTAAPEGMENVFILIPTAPDLSDDESTREKYFEMVMDRMERLTHQKIKDHIIFKKSYAHNDFISDYNAFKGNAYGLANTLKQTALLKPSMKSKKVKNLYYTGQLTVPGPGVPPSLISGQVVAEEILKQVNKK
ncbi:phytoene desaturase [Fulvivirga sp. M361]|uniref:phytoene desaturase family protein n=1 Tax=Fulvivirga sp. M361 TaxID=2594266 RepID=UPI00117A832C|nr:phytoene desaturase family protein [Fulvivirga sp. M361]TRX57551.1 phytoene desaturase [Fulvivirga sp. M361]